jgi:DNA polymerase III delta prime subunit
MNDIFSLPEDLHHAYVIEGDPTRVPEMVRRILEERGVIAPASSDVICVSYDSFTVADGSSIRAWHTEKGAQGVKRICIIGAKNINFEAEHSLLKILEEPHENTHFFIVVQTSGQMLPTLLSRVHVLSFPLEEETTFRDYATIFINASPKDRIRMVAEMIKEHEGDETRGGVRYHATRLLSFIESHLSHSVSHPVTDPHLHFVFSEIAQAREYLKLSGSSPKMILEHISLIM